MSAPKGGRQCSKDNHFDLMIKIGNSCDHYPFRLDQTHKASTTVCGDYLFGLDNTVIQTNTSQRDGNTPNPMERTVFVEKLIGGGDGRYISLAELVVEQN